MKITNRQNKKTWPNLVSILVSMMLAASPELFAPETSGLITEESSREANSREMRILSWNIAMLPVLDFVKTGKDRASNIGLALKDQDYDIIVFQEAFSPLARRAIYRRLCRDYPFRYGPANSGPSLKINSGVWVLSRLPLSMVREYRFSGCQGFDCLSRKGAILVEGEWDNQPFQLIGTHLESDDSDPSVREAQLVELHDSLIGPYSRPEVPQIICGDFNTDRNLPDQYSNMLRILNCEDGRLSGLEKITFGFPLTAGKKELLEKPRQLDYILTKNSMVLERINRKVAIIRDPSTNDYNQLSDHYGIEATIRFRSSTPMAGSL